MKNTADPITISQLAKHSAVSLETIRYYERQGLLPKPPRSTAGYRLFPLADVRRVRFIKRAQELGFSLKEIKQLLALRVTPGTTSADVRKRAEAKIADIEERLQTLRAMKKALTRLTATCCGTGSITECPILESLNLEKEKYDDD